MIQRKTSLLPKPRSRGFPHPLVFPFKKSNGDTRFPRLPTPPNRFHPARWLRSLLPRQNLEGKFGSQVGFNPIQVSRDNQIRSTVEPSKNRWIITIKYAPWRVMFNSPHKKMLKCFKPPPIVMVHQAMPRSCPCNKHHRNSWMRLPSFYTNQTPFRLMFKSPHKE